MAISLKVQGDYTTIVVFARFLKLGEREFAVSQPGVLVGYLDCEQQYSGCVQPQQGFGLEHTASVVDRGA